MEQKPKVIFNEAERRHAGYFLTLAWDALIAGEPLAEIDKPNFIKAVKVAKSFTIGIRSFIKAHIIAKNFKI